MCDRRIYTRAGLYSSSNKAKGLYTSANGGEYLERYKYYLSILLLMMKITKSSAQHLIEMYTNIYAKDRCEYVHVRDAETNQIVLEVNVERRFCKIFLDYQREAYVSVRLPWDDAFMLRQVGHNEAILTVSMEGVANHAIFAMEVVE